jgi:hypothetical protein
MFNISNPPDTLPCVSRTYCQQHFSPLSCTGNNIVRYVVLLFLAFFAGVFFVVQPLLPSARMFKLEDMVAETIDILQSANEEHMLSNHEEQKNNIADDAVPGIREEGEKYG